MTIETALQQFRTTGRTEVPFSTAYARRELIFAAIITVLVLVLTGTRISGSLTDLLDAGAAASERAVAALVLVFFLVALLIMIPLVVLAVRRLTGASPGVVLTTDGVRAARQSGPMRPTVPWSTLSAIAVTTAARGQQVVQLTATGGTTSLPTGLAQEPPELHTLLEQARDIAGSGT